MKCIKTGKTLGNLTKRKGSEKEKSIGKSKNKHSKTVTTQKTENYVKQNR
ncbi:MAG: hypothetical protein HFJ26_08990 [Clostridia bacterium]|nr:hypothetical protein [Clostridia bacterium]